MGKGGVVMARQDPLRNSRFRVEIDGFPDIGFSEVLIGGTATDVIEYREGIDPPHVRKLPGLHKYANVTLKRGVTSSMDLFNWHKQVLTGDIANARRNLAIIVLDETGQPQARFKVTAAWPAKYDPSDLNAKGNEVFIELLELANEGVERVQ
jgi:phage tail-like protein